MVCSLYFVLKITCTKMFDKDWGMKRANITRIRHAKVDNGYF